MDIVQILIITLQMKKNIPFINSIFIYLFLTGCSSFLFQKSPDYVKVQDTKFILSGKPYYFLGTNLWYGCYLGSSEETGNRERLIKELDLLKSLGITNLRILAASEKSEIKNSLKPTIQTEPGVYNENLLEGLDFLLNEMGKLEMKAVVFLNNYWEWSGGMAQYNAWTNGEKVADPDDPGFGWGEFMRLSATFYNNEAGNKLFKNYIETIINRKNTFNELFYYEDPTIMAWQLANEPRPWGSGELIDNYYKWIDSTAKFIHMLDPNHLVSTGNEGTMGSLKSTEYYVNAHKSKYVDYLTFHLWIKNWSWYDAKNYIATFDSAKIKATNYINQHIHLAKLLNKPITLEEFGIGRDLENYSTNSSTNVRDDYYNTVFSLVYDSASSGAPIAGTNFWTWAGYGRAQHDDFIWREGDPFLGDPPQEPQGLNSVFDTDTTTLNIIKKYSELMNGLRDKTTK
jgi:mannan endo-1,4-beta-mannosidase